MRTEEIFKKFGVKEDSYGHYFIPLEKGKLLVGLRRNHLTCNFFGAEERAKEKFGHWKQNIFLTGTCTEKEEQIERHLKRLINI